MPWEFEAGIWRGQSWAAGSYYLSLCTAFHPCAPICGALDDWLLSCTVILLQRLSVLDFLQKQLDDKWYARFFEEHTHRIYVLSITRISSSSLCDAYGRELLQIEWMVTGVYLRFAATQNKYFRVVYVSCVCHGWRPLWVPEAPRRRNFSEVLVPCCLCRVMWMLSHCIFIDDII